MKKCNGRIQCKWRIIDQDSELADAQIIDANIRALCLLKLREDGMLMIFHQFCKLRRIKHHIKIDFSYSFFRLFNKFRVDQPVNIDEDNRCLT